MERQQPFGFTVGQNIDKGGMGIDGDLMRKLLN